MQKYLLSKQAVSKEMQNIHSVLESSESNPIVLCHNDLHAKNLLRRGKDLVFIDYEYASDNYAAFDIGNHLMEYCGLHQFDPSLAPTGQEIARWIQYYNREWQRLTGKAHDIRQLFLIVSKCMIISNLYWTFWALTQRAEENGINFDYYHYAIQKLSFYSQHREKIFDDRLIDLSYLDSIKMID